ncbi:MAG: tetratricopeptide repeat protein [Candidatus Polarisedimenticolia bacterium]
MITSTGSSRHIHLLNVIICCLLLAAQTRATIADADSDLRATGLIAYFEDRFADAVASWRSVIESREADGVLLYRYSYALARSDGDKSEIERVRRQARRALADALESGGNPIECYYLGALQEDDASRLDLTRGCFNRFRETTSEDGETLYFLTRLASDDEHLAADRERLLRRSIETFLASKDPPAHWLERAAVDLGSLLTESERAAESLPVYEQALGRLPGNLSLLEYRGYAFWQLDRNSEAEADFKTVLEKDPRRSKVWMDLGYALHDQDRCAEAMAAFKKALELGHEGAGPHNGLGLCLKRSSDIPGAIAAFREAARISQDNATIHRNLANALDENGQGDAAEKEARIVIRLDPTGWAGFRLLADLLSRRGDIHSALETYRKAASTIGEPDLAWATMGRVLTDRGRAAEALEPLNQAVEIDPNYADWRRYLGSALEALKRNDEAESAYRKAIELKPDEPIHHGYLGSLLEDLGRLDEALKSFARAEELSPDYAFAVERTAVITGRMNGPQALLDYLEPRLERFKDNAPILRRAGIAYDQLDRLEPAERVLRQATTADPRFDLGIDSLAIVLDEADRPDEAVEVLEAGLKANPDSSTLNFRMGVMLDSSGRPAEAESRLLRAIELDSGNATAWNSLGAAQDHLGKTSDASAAFQRALELRQPFPLARMNLGRMQRKLGLTEEAISTFRRVLQDEPKNADAWGLLAEQLLKANQAEEALDAATKGIEVDPSRPACSNVRGDALLALKREGDALEAYRTAQQLDDNDEYPFRKEAEVLHGRQEYLEEIEVLDRCLARFPKSGYALRQKGLALYKLQRNPEALAMHRAALAVSDQDWIAWAGVGDASYKLEQFDEARAAYARSVEINAEFAAGHAALGDVLEKLDRREDAIAKYRAAVAIDGKSSYQSTLAGLLRKAGKPREAEKLLREALEAGTRSTGTAPPATFDPDVLRRALAQLYAATSRPAMAVPILQAVVSARPKDLELRRELARTLRDAGLLEESADELRAALELDADDQESLAMLKGLPHGIGDVDAFLKGIRPKPLAIDVPDTQAILKAFKPDDPQIAPLLHNASQVGWDHCQVQVREGGLLTETVHEIQWPLDASSAEDLGEYRIAWAPQRQQLEVHLARTHLPDGRVLDAAPEAYHRVAPSDTSTQNVYSDNQILVISMPQVQPGAAIEVQYTRKTKSTLTDQQWWSGWAFQGISPFLASSLVLQVPKRSSVHHEAGPAAPKPEVREEESWTTYVWTASNLPGIRREVASPPMNDLRALVRASSYSSWDDVAAWLHGLARNQYDLDEGARADLMSLIASAGSPQEKVRRLYYHLQESIRYVAVELGISSYQPHRASETLRNRYGDCKDRGALLIAMLKTAGIRALPAFVATRERGGILHGAPSPGQFNHFIVYVPDLDTPGDAPGTHGVFIDATSEHGDLGVLPDVVQGVEAFVVEDGKGRFIRTPVSRPEDNRRLLKRTVTVGADGSATVIDDATAFGHFATHLRDSLAQYDEHARKELVERSVRDDFPTATDVEYKFTNCETAGGVPRDYETYRVVGLARQVGKSSVISLDLLDSIKHELRLSPAAERTMDYEADVPLIFEERLEIRLEGGRTFTEWPEPVDLDTPHARLEIRLTPDSPGSPAGLLVEGKFTLKHRTIPVSDYAEFASVVERALSAGHLTFLLR